MKLVIKDFNNGSAHIPSELGTIVEVLETHKPQIFTGRYYRQDILNLIKKTGKWSEKEFTHPLYNSIAVDSVSLGVKTPVGLSVQVSHSDAGKSQLLDMEALYREGFIEGAIFATQTLSEGILRNKKKNPEAKGGSHGNRIHFEFICEQLSILESFLEIPLVVIGFQSD